MNVSYFEECVDLMSHSGFRLTDMEYALVENSLIILQSDNKFRDVLFLGRIETTGTEHYYVAFGYTNDILKERKYFYSLNGYEWVLMPKFKANLVPIARNVKSFFRGDPSYVEEVCMSPKFIPDDEEVFILCQRAPKKIKEEDRLACVVKMMMHESAVIPRGAVYRQVNRSVTYNTCFRGLSHLDASLLINFQLFRYPVNNRTFNLTKREDYNYQTDFLDTIDDLVPSKSFSVTINDRDICILRSFKWPGMFFLQKLNTPLHGFFYFGNGRESMDSLFMT